MFLAVLGGWLGVISVFLSWCLGCHVITCFVGRSFLGVGVWSFGIYPGVGM